MVMGFNAAIDIRTEAPMDALVDNLAFVLFLAAQLLAVIAVPAMRFDNGFAEPRRRRARRAGPSPYPVADA